MVQIFVLVQTEVGRAGLVASALREVSGVVSAEAVTGPYDVVVRAEGEGDAQVRDIVGHIQKVDSITRTLTCQVVDQH
ncbi:Lrp/AsnC ligand binding domain-containing protein [Rhodococcus sp. BP-252]|uniref:AsnC family transcriptional regulator n=1 Tax=Rhodococcoides kyotonense TaxID=398843 RepID=A0A177YBW8_9NOCA|nr:MULTISPECIES: Lrp/AsnC ligand binding domain-containing protein [Rhodococcus]MBY6411165.1 Lrp/AsnC ligand binding domain-containing protein [Rhodococcus sp. BP-320]MBY6415824.1 Lrp/AsnC ligand binding domain-containing protein [Rhodococcus sp. BP-321]MBY6424355.1 Lrp/AsnC ligand binding domain-containing protein [Rhodococcus sp. BP-324]MBY6425849.1 Lrp/AsnC ligand binding domain-containing protein [Rhodococcus sp. BP-323]MBY6431030.1 Lrp/AsnC ligand binding domain-containing protein [Rhodoc